MLVAQLVRWWTANLKFESLSITIFLKIMKLNLERIVEFSALQ